MKQNWKSTFDERMPVWQNYFDTDCASKNTNLPNKNVSSDISFYIYAL